MVSIYDELPRLPDEDILAFAVRDDRIVITNDKDFGELVFRDRRPHRGVILLRLANRSGRVGDTRVSVGWEAGRSGRAETTGSG